VQLAPGKTAHAVLVLHAAENYDEDTCKPLKARGFRVYPPDETAAVFVAAPQTVCSAGGVNTAQVQPMAAGPGTGS
ncbi:MAG: DUF4232 domain-containing protein, partial [Actinoplanes sp.]